MVLMGAMTLSGQPFAVDVQPVNHGRAEALCNGVRIDGMGLCVRFQDLIEMRAYPAPGYELDHYEVYDALRVPNPPVNVTWANPPSNTIFYMPLTDVYVVPVFRLRTFNVYYDDQIGNGDVYVFNLDTGVGGPMGRPIPATFGQTIRMDAQPYWDFINFAYFVLEAYWSVSPSTHLQLDGQMVHYETQPTAWHPNWNPWVTYTEDWYLGYFTMPPFDVLVSAYIDDDVPPPPLPTKPLHLLARMTPNGVLLLHEVNWSKQSNRTTGWDDPENYGWSSAVPGQSMYFTVAPNLGYQVKKSDITVKLFDMTNYYQGYEGQLFMEFRGSDGEIGGPDEFVTDPTDYSFIFDAPAGVDPSLVRVEITADIRPIDYMINVAIDDMGYVTLLPPETATVGETVTVPVIAEPGYRLESLIVVPETPGFLTTVSENNKFVMPASNVTLFATFMEVEFQLGDVNCDGMIGIADVTDLIDFILGNDPQPFNYDAGDVTGDGMIGIADVTTLIDYILLGTW